MKKLTPHLLVAVSIGAALPSLTCCAQTATQNTPLPRYYVAAHLNRTNYELLGPGTLGVAGTSP